MTSYRQANGALGEILPYNFSKKPYSPFTDRLPEELSSVLSDMMVQLDDITGLVSKMTESFQEHHKQVESFFQLLDALSRSPSIQEMVRTVQVSAKKEAKQGPEAGNPQDPKFKATLGPQPSPRRHCLSEVEEQQDPQPVWHKEPQFWGDILTQELWELFTGTQENHQGPGEKLLGLESKDPGLCDSGIEPRHRDSLSDCGTPILTEFPSDLFSISQKDISLLHYQPQELSGRAGPFLQPLAWDSEDLEHSWQRPCAAPWQAPRSTAPQALQKVRVLRHRELLLALAASCLTRHVFTCSRGGIKVWSLAKQVVEDGAPESHLRCGVQTDGAYLRTCLLAPDSRTLFAGGHSLPGVSVWDLAAPALHEKCQLPCKGLSCQALASADDSMAFAGFTDGTVRMWDLRSKGVVRDLEGPVSAAKSLVVKDNMVWTGGLDARLRCWDLRMANMSLEFTFQSQIMSLSHSPLENWLLLGLASGQHCLFDSCKRDQPLMVGTKDKAVLSLKFSPNGRWWASVGMGGLLTIHSMPTGAKLFQIPEAAAITCCDVTADSKLIVTGCGDRASVYQINY